MNGLETASKQEINMKNFIAAVLLMVSLFAMTAEAQDTKGTTQEDTRDWYLDWYVPEVDD